MLYSGVDLGIEGSTSGTSSPAKKRKLGTVKSSATVNSSESTNSGVTDTSGTISLDSMEVECHAQPKVLPKPMSNKKFTKKLLTDRDIRTRFANMFSSAFNNFDKDYFVQILRNYCEEDLLVIYEYVGVNPYNSPNYIEVRGFETVAVFWDGLLTTIPDSLFEIHSTKYKILPNDFTSIVCTFSFGGTKVYGLKGIDGTANRNVIVSCDRASASSSSSSPRSPRSCDSKDAEPARVMAGTVSERNSQLTTMGDSEAFLVERSEMMSMKITVVGTLTFYVNPSKKIYRISFVHSVKA